MGFKEIITNTYIYSRKQAWQIELFVYYFNAQEIDFI